MNETGSMNMGTLLIVFMVCEVLTPLVVEGIKRSLEELGRKYACNVLVLFASFVVSTLAMSFVYLKEGIPFTLLNIFYIIFMFGANWLGSMLGYDKIKQAILQITDKKNED